MQKQKSFKHAVIAMVALLAVPVSSQSQEQELVRTFSTRPDAIKHSTGFVRQMNSEEFMVTTARRDFSKATTPIPRAYAIRYLAGPVEDQGQCGSCWDFSLTSTLRGSLMMHGHDPGRLSFNYLLNCSPDMLGCEGGDFSAAAHLIKPYGAPKYGADGIYTESQSKCDPVPAVASANSYKLLGKDGGIYPNAPEPSFKDIAYIVGVMHQPVSIDITVTDAFQSYAGGIFNDCSDNDPKNINHMVVIEGYNCETSVDKAGNCVFDKKGNLPNGVGTWLIRNSWGTSWGDGGYITMKATNHAGARCNSVAADALYFDVK